MKNCRSSSDKIYEKKYEKQLRAKLQKKLRSIRPSQLWRATINAKKKSLGEFFWRNFLCLGVGSGDSCDVRGPVGSADSCDAQRSTPKKSLRNFFWRNFFFEVWEAGTAVTWAGRSIRPSERWRVVDDAKKIASRFCLAKKKLWGVGSGDSCDACLTKN